MSPELREEIQLEVSLLRRLVAEIRPILQAAAKGQPVRTETLAAAALLHAFYTGVENVFKRVAADAREALPVGAAWHRELLNSMGLIRARRAPVISEEMCLRLRPYLDFRHFFRHNYSFRLDWARLSPLAEGMEETLAKLETELQQFLEEAR